MPDDRARRRILIVDDTPENLTTLIRVLEQEDYAIHTALSGRRALQVAAREPAGSGAARHPHARDGRLRGLPPTEVPELTKRSDLTYKGTNQEWLGGVSLEYPMVNH